MENASKALIMAGSVLIALMIIGALLLMFNNLSNYQDVGIEETRDAQVVAFNNQFETYNRDNVRGSDLYSLLNKVVDYNRRKSTEGTGQNDEGQFLAYEPMKITFNFDKKLDMFRAPTSSANDTYTYLIKHNEYIQSSTVNTFQAEIGDTVSDLEDKYGADSLTKLVAKTTEIFIPNNSTDEEKQEAVEEFKRTCKKNKIGSIDVNTITWDDIKEQSQIRKDVYQYYEYVQFKRAQFNCEGTDYSNQTGRIIEMNFKFNGNFL